MVSRLDRVRAGLLIYNTSESEAFVTVVTTWIHHTFPSSTCLSLQSHDESDVASLASCLANDIIIWIFSIATTAVTCLLTIFLYYYLTLVHAVHQPSRKCHFDLLESLHATYTYSGTHFPGYPPQRSTTGKIGDDFKWRLGRSPKSRPCHHGT